MTENNKKEPALEDLQKKVEELEKQKTEYLAGWQRERADFLNYKKDEMERISQLIGYAKEGIVSEILPILDNFEQAQKEVEKLKDSKNVEEVVKGFLQIKNQLTDFLKKLGVEEIKSVGEKFDARLHEVVEELEAKDKEPGIIVEEVQKGYKINGRLFRPARVRVTK